MPRKNVQLIVGLAFLALLCYQRAGARYGRVTEVFSEVLARIDQSYVTEVDQEKLLRGALDGMVQQLDEYSAYIGPERLPQFEQELTGKFGGIGIQVSLDQDSGRLTVMTPLVGTPAYEAGILAGDQILSIDGTSTEGLSLDEAVSLMKGGVGEPVVLKILHRGEEDVQEFKIIRDIIRVETVLGDARQPDGSWDFMLPGPERIGYIRISTFSEDTVAELTAALQTLQQQGMQGLILDLRNNPGGYLDAAIRVCDLFLDSGRIVSTQRRSGTESIVDATADASDYLDVPLAIIVNGQSASASEIVAACLQDHGRAIIVGERSYGKGSVQEVLAVGRGNRALKLTVATYWRPSGENIHRFQGATEDEQWGVKPNAGFEVELDTKEFEAVMLDRRDRDLIRETVTVEEEAPVVDRQLQRAIEAIQQQLTDAAN